MYWRKTITCFSYEAVLHDFFEHWPQVGYGVKAGAYADWTNEKAR